MHVEYLMVIEPAEHAGDASFSAFFPDLPGCTTWGESLEDLRKNAEIAVSEHIAALHDLGKPVPAPRMRPEIVSVQAS